MKKLMLLLASFMLCVSCSGGKSVGTPAPNSEPLTSLSALLENPAEYHNKTIVMKGVLSAQCASLCDFTYTEKGKSVSIDTRDAKPSKLKVGTPMRVTAKIHSGKEQVIFTAVGLNILPKGKRGE